jgi:hypothetical protein
MQRHITIRVAAVAGMTAAEAIAGTVWLTVIHATSAPGDGGVLNDDLLETFDDVWMGDNS